MINPKISLNKLAEYLDANVTRRKRIVKDAKEPANFIVTRYSDARTAICNYIIDNYNAEVLNDAIENISEKESASEFQEQDNALSIEILEVFLDIDLPDLDTFTIEKYVGGNPKLKFNNVDVSVNPDLIIRGEYRGQQICGAIKLHFSKTNKHDEESGKNVATLLKKFVEEHVVKEDEVVKNKFCIAIESFGKNYEIAPNSYARRLARISDACQEISLWWDEV